MSLQKYTSKFRCWFQIRPVVAYNTIFAMRIFLRICFWKQQIVPLQSAAVVMRQSPDTTLAPLAYRNKYLLLFAKKSTTLIPYGGSNFLNLLWTLDFFLYFFKTAHLALSVLTNFTHPKLINRGVVYWILGTSILRGTIVFAFASLVAIIKVFVRTQALVSGYYPVQVLSSFNVELVSQLANTFPEQ